MNRNYEAGRRLEYGRRKHWQKRKFIVLRSSGSHGAFDLVCLRNDEVPSLIQCKRTASLAEGKRLLREFESDPPLSKSLHYKQIMEVQVKGSREILSVEV